MIQDRLRDYKSEIEQGDPVAALAGLVCLWRQPGQEKDAILALTNQAFRKCAGNYADTRNRLFELIQEAGAPEELDACLCIFGNFQDTGAIDSCRDLDIKIDPSVFYKGFADYVDHHLTGLLMKGKDIDLGEYKFNDSRNKLLAIKGAYLTFRRDGGEAVSPVIEAGRGIDLGAAVWSVAFDPATNRYIAILPAEERVLGINADTLKAEIELASPAEKLRGLAIHTGLRRGFFNAEFSSVMVSFDLDSFCVRRQIAGFSFRPERVYLHAPTNTLVAGNLGMPCVIPNADDHLFFNSLPRPEGNNPKPMTMTLIDAEKEKVIATLPTGRRPTAVDISGKYVAAGNFYDNSLTVYERNDLSTGVTIKLDVVGDVVINHKIGDRPTGAGIDFSKTYRARVVEGIAILDKRDQILVSGFDACLLIVVDIKKRRVSKLISVESRPFDVICDAAEKFAYVSCHGSNKVSVIDLDLMTEICRLETGSMPQDLTLAGDSLLIPHSTGITIHDVSRLHRH